MDLDLETTEDELKFVLFALRTFDASDRNAVIAFCKSLYLAKYRDSRHTEAHPSHARRDLMA